jgi:hypothetical protein
MTDPLLEIRTVDVSASQSQSGADLFQTELPGIFLQLPPNVLIVIYNSDGTRVA